MLVDHEDNAYAKLEDKMWTGWTQKSKPRKNKWRRLWRFLGVRRSKDHMRAMVWAMAVCVVMVGLLVGMVYAALQYRYGRQNEAENKQAMLLVDKQLAALSNAGGLALGKQCFDNQGVPQESTGPNAPCSYYMDSALSGCLSDRGQRCYTVHIASINTEGTAADKTVLVTYEVSIVWGLSGRLTVVYRLVQANQAYEVNLVHTNAMDLPQDISVNTNNGSSISGGKVINRLSDITGGPGVSVGMPVCKHDDPCYGAAGRYSLTGVFTVSTNIPSYLITGCTWDFGDNSGQTNIISDQQGCDAGQTVLHDYQNTWQLQNLPPFPQSCFAPLGSGVDTHAFSATVVLHTTEGVDVMSKAPTQAILPSC